MSDGLGDQGGEQGVGDGGAAAAAALANAGDQSGAATPEWLGGLPDDLKGDATLSRFKDIEALARGHVEAHKVAKSKVLLPAADADETAWGAFFDAAGRPKEASAYELPLPEGDDGAFAESFKPIAHKLGFLPQQAKGLAEWWNGFQAEQVTAMNAASKAEVDALAAEMGADFQPKLAAARGLLKSLGVDEATVEQIDMKLGSGNLLKIFMGLADKAGEHGRIDGDVEALGGLSDPMAAIDAKLKDADWRKRYLADDAGAVGEYNRLMAAAKAKAVPKKAA